MAEIYQGLKNKEVQKRLKKYGYNEIVTVEKWVRLKIFLSQFKSFLIIILMIAGTISFALHETIDSIAIFTIVFINAFIGYIQEFKAENAVKALRKMVLPMTIVIREGEKKEISVKELVPGDTVLLAEGDKVPADLKILEAYSLKVDESMLTGESTSINKEKAEDKSGILYKGTIITTGRAIAEVTYTGSKTEFGKIVELVSREEDSKSPLAYQLDDLGKKLGIFILILILILFVIGTLREFGFLRMFMTSVALGVSAIPEGMPIIVTLTLAMGVQILAKKNAIVRKMNAIETLGATTIICSDKTGTLTLNEMTVKKIYCDDHEIDVPGLGFDWNQKFRISSIVEKKLMEISQNCNNSTLGKKLIGDPTELALKVMAQKSSHVVSYTQLDEKSFTSERKMMSSLHQIDKKKEIFAKGAFEVIIQNCSFIFQNGKIRKLTPKDKEKLSKIAEDYAKDALRVLAMAYKPFQKEYDEKNLIFVGIAGMLDPPRDSVKASLKTALEAGIDIKIITGDNALTAEAIGKQIGLNIKNIAVGEQIDHLNDRELLALINKTQIFARTSPHHKYRIVDLLMRENQIVAVTGDGVNDAPALKHADVGIAMGIKGTEATKEVADIILKDDNFSTIVNTIEEGRRIYQNILAFIKYMLSANFSSIFMVSLLTLGGYPLPILPLQILWINLATDALPALALGAGKAAPGIMKTPPHPKNENLFKKFSLFIFSALIIQVIANITLYFYGIGIDNLSGLNTSDLSIPSHARTLVFTQIVVFELFLAFVCTEEKLSIKRIFNNKKLIGAVIISFILQLLTIYLPPMQTVFKTVPLSLKEMLVVILFGMAAFLVPTITKISRRLFK